MDHYNVQLSKPYEEERAGDLAVLTAKGWLLPLPKIWFVIEISWWLQPLKMKILNGVY